MIVYKVECYDSTTEFENGLNKMVAEGFALDSWNETVGGDAENATAWWSATAIYKATKARAGNHGRIEVPCTNGARCHGTNHEITQKPNGDISLLDDHDSNAGQADFTRYCSLQCLLLDVWHELGNDGEKIGDKIRALKELETK
jgi:hypothetical protein